MYYIKLEASFAFFSFYGTRAINPKVMHGLKSNKLSQTYMNEDPRALHALHYKLQPSQTTPSSPICFISLSIPHQIHKVG